MYLDEHQEYLKARSGKTTNGKPVQSQPGKAGPAPVVDITSGAPLPPGFQTRRAG